MRLRSNTNCNFMNIKSTPLDGNMDHHQDKSPIFFPYKIKTLKFCSIVVRHSPKEKSVTVASNGSS